MAKDIAKRIRALKKAKNVTAEEMAKEMGYTVPAIYRMTTQGITTISTLVVVADYFNVSLDWLCGRTRVLAVNR